MHFKLNNRDQYIVEYHYNLRTSTELLVEDLDCVLQSSKMDPKRYCHHPPPPHHVFLLKLATTSLELVKDAIVRCNHVTTESIEHAKGLKSHPHRTKDLILLP